MCFLTLCDRGFNKKLAYSFLEDLSQEFYSQYGHKINTANRPYSFIEFGESVFHSANFLLIKTKVSFSSDTYIQRAKKTYMNQRGGRNLNALNSELQDVQRIMVQNIDDVLQRGAVLSGTQCVL